MRLPSTNSFYWGAAGLLLAGSAAWARLPLLASDGVHRLPVASIPPSANVGVLQAQSDSIVADDLFRVDRSAADSAFVSGTGTGSPAGSAAAPRPAPPKITAIVGGPPWRAVLEGTANHEGGIVVQQGDRVGVLLIESVTRHAARLKAPDTTWILELKP